MNTTTALRYRTRQQILAALRLAGGSLTVWQIRDTLAIPPEREWQSWAYMGQMVDEYGLCRRARWGVYTLTEAGWRQQDWHQVAG